MDRTFTRKKINKPIKLFTNEQIDSSEFPLEPGAHVIINILNYSKTFNANNLRDFESLEKVN